MYRVILKKTGAFKKGSARGNSRNKLGIYLGLYVDEVGKMLSKSKENLWERERGEVGEEERWLLPKDRSGILTLGGFLGWEKSPGVDDKGGQKAWIRRVCREWEDALKFRNKRKSDGVRVILSLAPESVAQLTRAKLGVDTALGEIWETTMELYREHHGWAGEEDELAWIWGAHHDTDNTHIHAVVFPTTKSGKPIRTSFRSKEGKNDLADWIGMANLAAELYWREHLPLKYQSKEYIQAVTGDSEGEPPLPDIETYGRKKAGPIGIIEHQMTEIENEEDGAEYNEGSIVQTIKANGKRGRGFRRLRSLYFAEKVCEQRFWEEKPWPVTDIFWIGRKRTGEFGSRIRAKHQEGWEKVREILDKLKSVIKRGRLRDFLEELSHVDEMGRLVMELSIGMEELSQKEPESEELAKLAIQEALNFEKQGKLEDKEQQIYNGLLGLNQGVEEWKLREIRMRAILRKVRRSAPELEGVVQGILRGMICIRHILSGSREKAHCLVKKNQGVLEKRRVFRTWVVEDDGPTQTPSEGPPYPEHLDPETMILPLLEGKKGISELSKKKSERFFLSKERKEEEFFSLQEGRGDTQETIHPLTELEKRRFFRWKRRRDQASKLLRSIKLKDNQEEDEIF